MSQPKTSTPATIVKVPFRGGEVLAAEVNGKPHVILKPAFEAIGLDYSTQLAKLKRKSWATVGLAPMVAEDGRVREMASCDLRTFLMLLATVDEGRVAAPVREMLVAYQAEVADAIESYFTDGGAINPRATDTQLEHLAEDIEQRRIALTEAKLKMLNAGRNVVDAVWLDAKARHVIAQGLGEEPEIDPATRPLTVGEYLEGRSVKGAALRSLSTRFGRNILALHRERFACDPPKVDRFVDGALRSVYGYNESHRPLFDEVYAALTQPARSAR